MKYVNYSDSMVAQMVVGVLNSMVRKHQDYMQKYKSKLEKVEETSTIPQVKDQVHDMILVLEGKRYE